MSDFNRCFYIMISTFFTLGYNIIKEGDFMKLLDRFKTGIEGLSSAFGRFPLTAAFLVAVAILNAMMINEREFDFEKYLATFIVGALLSIVFQMAYERFCKKNIARIFFMILAAVLTLGYYMIIMNIPELSMEIGIKTAVALFGLFIGFLWVPSIKSKITFNESFMAGFKSFFIAYFFSGVLFAGLSMVYGATDQLLFEVNNKIYPHTANIVFVLFATMYFLSLTPRYPGNMDMIKQNKDVDAIDDEVSKATFCPKYLELLISYIVIPLSMIFTLILLLYIVINIRGSFWEDALLEPMLVAYIVVVILLYILASRLENRFAEVFRKVFPKVLLPIVIFQTVNSFLRIGDFGLTHGRYYVILFGIFAFISGIVFSFKPVEKNGLVPMVLIICIVISIVPPIDAFSISRRSQVRILENVLINNGMLVGGEIIPNSEVEEDTREKITETARYLYRMDYIGDLEWLPEDFDYYKDFDDVFGFPSYVDIKRQGDYIYISTDMDGMIDISGYDWFVQTHVVFSEYDDRGPDEYLFVDDGVEYRVVKETNEEDFSISVYDSNDTKIIDITGSEIIAKFQDYYLKSEMIPIEEAQVVSENDKGAIKVVIQYIDIYDSDEEYRYNAEIYLLVKIK